MLISAFLITIIVALIAVNYGIDTSSEKTHDLRETNQEIIPEITSKQETQPPTFAEWKSAWKKVVPEILTTIRPYTTDQCEFYINSLQGTIEIFELRNNMIMDNLESDTPDQKIINTLIRDNTTSKKGILNEANHLVKRSCISVSEIDPLVESLTIPKN